MRDVARSTIAAIAITLSMFCSSEAIAAPAACKKIVVANGTFIYKNSAPLRAGGVGTRLIGYRKNPTLIMERNVSLRGGVNILNERGKSIGRCPWSSAEGASGGRYRCTMETSSLRRAAVGSTGSASIYFPVRGGCIKVPDAGRCYGSVKGLCTQMIR